MNNEYINTALLAILFLMLFGIAELLYYKFNVKADTTRKVVHLGTGLLCLLFPSMLHSHWFVFFLCGSFAVILYASLKLNLLKSINAIDRVSYGSLLYPLIVYICFLIYNYFNNYIYFYLPLLIMSICDPIAAVIGKRWPYGKFYIRKDNKTIMGSAAFFISSSIITLILIYFLLPNNDKFLIAFSVALAATLAEALFVKGFDNFTIPLSVIMILIVLHV